MRAVQGAIRKRDVVSHPVAIIKCFGWDVFVRSLLAGRDQTFLSIVAQTMLVVVELPEFIKRAVQLELGAMEIYRSLSERFASSEPVSRFFAELADQEKGHAELLRLCHSSADRQIWGEGYFEPWRDPVDRLEDRMRTFERRADQIVSVTDALRLVIEVESSEINDVFRAMVESSQSRLVREVRAFRSAEEKQMELIRRTIPTLAPDLAESCAVL